MKTEDETLTFAEAMSLDPSEVKVRFDEQWWLLSDARIQATLCLRDLIVSTFRRARPRRSRVQEMAEAESISYPRDVPLIQQTEARYVRAIRAVCEWLRAESRRGFEHNPDAIERHFLEPR